MRLVIVRHGETNPKQIRQLAPGWDVCHDGCPHGDSTADVGRRADARFLSQSAVGPGLTGGSIAIWLTNCIRWFWTMSRGAATES